MNLSLKLIQEILNHLDNPADLRNCLLVSRGFKESIIKAPKLMRKLTVTLQNETWKDNLKFLYEYGSNVKSMKLSNIEFGDSTEFTEILSKVPNLERLEVTNCHIIKMENGLNETNLLEMTHLKIDGSDTINQLLLNMLKSSSKIKVSELHPPDTNSDFSELLVQQENLKELTMYSNNKVPFPSTKIYKNFEYIKRIKFSLEKLSINERTKIPMGHLEDFLLSQAKSITELYLHTSMTFSLFSCIAKNFDNLEKFHFRNWRLQDENLEEMQNLRMEKVKEVQFIYFCTSRPQELKALINVFPNITTLNCGPSMFSSLNGILNKFSQLSSISTAEFSINVVRDVELENLKILKISTYAHPDPSYLWREFFLKCPNIQQIIIESFGSNGHKSVKQNFLEFLKTLKLLKNLRLFYANISIRATFDDRVPITKVLKIKVDKDSETLHASRDFQLHFVEALKVLKNTFGMMELEKIYDD